MNLEQALSDYLSQEDIKGAFDARICDAPVGWYIEYQVPEVKWTLFHRTNPHKLIKFLFEYTTQHKDTEETELNRKLVISYDVPDASELWIIEIIDEDAPKEITPKWLNENPEGWVYVDLKYRYGEGMTNLVVEEEL
jgi:hypothetical protein